MELYKGMAEPPSTSVLWYKDDGSNLVYIYTNSGWRPVAKMYIDDNYIKTLNTKPPFVIETGEEVIKEVEVPVVTYRDNYINGNKIPSMVETFEGIVVNTTIDINPVNTLPDITIFQSDVVTNLVIPSPIHIDDETSKIFTIQVGNANTKEQCKLFLHHLDVTSKVKHTLLIDGIFGNDKSLQGIDLLQALYTNDKFVRIDDGELWDIKLSRIVNLSQEMVDILKEKYPTLTTEGYLNNNLPPVNRKDLVFYGYSITECNSTGNPYSPVIRDNQEKSKVMDYLLSDIEDKDSFMSILSSLKEHSFSYLLGELKAALLLVNSREDDNTFKEKVLLIEAIFKDKYRKHVTDFNSTFDTIIAPNTNITLELYNDVSMYWMFRNSTFNMVTIKDKGGSIKGTEVFSNTTMNTLTIDYSESKNKDNLSLLYSIENSHIGSLDVALPHNEGFNVSLTEILSIFPKVNNSVSLQLRLKDNIFVEDELKYLKMCLEEKNYNVNLIY